MKWRDLLANWGLTQLKFTVGFLAMEWKPQEEDRLAAWDLYIELLTRITTQVLPDEVGDEQAALASVHSLFATTREILKTRGPGAQRFAPLAIAVLNQIVRPFTAKWHRESLAGAFKKPARCATFRKELATLRAALRVYAQALSRIAGVEDLTAIEAD